MRMPTIGLGLRVRVPSSVSSPISYVTIDQLTLNLVDISLDNKLQILSKLLLCFAKIGKIDCSKITKIWLVTFCIFNLKIVYFSQF